MNKKHIDFIDNAEFKVADKETEKILAINEKNRKDAKKEPVKWMFKDRLRRKAFNNLRKTLNVDQAYLMVKESTNEEIKTLANHQ